MKIVFCILLAAFPLAGFSQKDSTGRKIETALTFSINSNGLASIPAFSLGKPAVIASINLKKGRISYDPVLAYSLEMKPWFIDNWFHYKVVERKKFELVAGINFSTFCSGMMIGDTEIIRAERYFALAVSPTYNVSQTSSISFDYWSDNGKEKGSISGHFLSLSFEKSEIPIGKVMLSLNVMLFQLFYDGNNDGLFVSPAIAFSLPDFPLGLFFQSTQPISTNIEPSPGFRWNAGLSYSF